MEIDENAKAQFYSAWFYSGIRLSSSIEGHGSVEAIAEHLDLPRTRVRQVLEFLVANGLCEFKNGEYGMGPSRTHLDGSSSLVSRHHSNWRIKAFEKMDHQTPEELFYTGPMAISAETMSEVRQEIIALIDRMAKKVATSPSEQLACLNIDFFKPTR